MYVNVKSTKRRTCYAKATGRAAETKGRQGVHPTPWQSTKRRTCHAKATGRAAETKPHLPRKSHRHSGGDQGTPGRTSDPLAEHQVPHLPRKSNPQTGGDQGTPGRTSDPWQSTLSHACHAKDTGRAAKTKGRQGVHPTPCRAPSAAPAMQKQPADRRRPRDASAYIRPLATGRPAETKGRQRVHPTPGSAASAAPATQKPPAQRRRPMDARAYIRPLAPHLPRKRDRQSGGDQGTPGRTSDPWQSTLSYAADSGKGPRGVHRTRSRPPSAAPATQTPPAERRLRDARAYFRPLAVHIVPRLPRKSHPTPCRAPSAAPATQTPPAERRRPCDVCVSDLYECVCERVCVCE